MGLGLNYKGKGDKNPHQCLPLIMQRTPTSDDERQWFSTLDDSSSPTQPAIVVIHLV